ncbi:hypothetical protein [Legionella spiritensis]|uniref:hypothetical protein n=1 Tax=Legionella spiritensis TaxID=452 RepID=UPI000F6C2454|nr:hypothetical protein [Legionella spiritensis]VEG89835.1 Uncharacterised protein [Legionella spiritensis]
MTKMSGIYRLLLVLAFFWGITILFVSWKNYEQEKDVIYRKWYSALTNSLGSDENKCLINNQEISLPQIIKNMEENCNKKSDPFLLFTTSKIKTKYQSEIDNILSFKFVSFFFFIWLFPILVLYLLIISIIWIYMGFKE